MTIPDQMTACYTYSLTGSIKLHRKSKEHADDAVYCVLEGIEEDSEHMFGVELDLRVKRDEAKDLLNTLRARVLEMKDREEWMLKDMYDKGWTVMARTSNGSGYEACVEIIKMIDGMIGGE